MIKKKGGVAQMVRACGSYPQSHWFKSSHRHHQKACAGIDIGPTSLIFFVMWFKRIGPS